MRRLAGTASGASSRFRGSENRIRKLGASGAWLCCVLLTGLGVSPSAIGQTTVTYIHTDALGSVVAESDANSNVIKRYDYEPYGAVVAGQVADGPGYTGHVSDATTGLNYMQQRYMDPQLGVFLSVDPVTAYDQPVGQFNRYRYANGNPYRFKDPDGRQSWANTGTANIGPVAERACNGSLECQKEVARDTAAAQGAMVSAFVPLEGLAVNAIRSFYALRAEKGFAQGKRFIESVTDGLAPTGGRSGRRTLQAEGAGGSDGAGKMFDKLTGGSSVERGGGRLGSMADGTMVQMSSRVTKDGLKETSVRVTSENIGSRIRTEIIKVRFREEVK